MRAYHFFCAFLKNRQNKFHFSVSVDFFRVLSRTEKSYNYSVGFRIFLWGYFETHRKMRTETNAQKNLSPTEQFEFLVVHGTRQRGLCRVPRIRHSAKRVLNFFKKFPLCRVPSLGHSAKSFRKKKSLPSAVSGALGKVFSKKNLCRVPNLGHSAKNFYKKNFLCRVLG